MALGPRLDLRQSQQLVMTPQLQQAIKLLTLTNLELESFLSGELEKNPLLEASSDEREPEDASPADAPDFDASDDGFEVVDGLDAPEPATADRLIEHGDGTADAPLDVDYTAETFHHDSGSDAAGAGLDGSLGLNGGGAISGSSGEAPTEGFEAMLTAELSLADVLLEQANAAFSGPELIIARYLIDLIDEAGYLTGSLAEIATRLQTSTQEVERVLMVIQSFEPTGIGARSLSECIAIQAREADRYDPAMAKLIANLDLLARGELGTLRRICQVDQEDLSDMIRELRTYNPKPGLAYGGERSQTVVPDIFVARTASGGWAVELNSATLPRVLVNRSYYVELSGRTKGREGRAFLSDCLASANWLVKALDQRARTIVKVATELVRQQEAFFTHGVHHLKPLNLRTIADAIGMHESTVSRVTSNKYLSCDRGLFELKYFFTSAIQSSDGEAVSAQAVKQRIRELIAAETADSILSDDKLVEILRAEKFDIARRTVAKYREAMNIGSSVQRRRQRLLEGSKDKAA